MKLEKLHPFIRMIIGAFGGAIAGMAAGFVIAYCIFKVTNQFDVDGSMPPASMLLFLGMGIGSVVGSLLGGISINKK